MDLDQQGGVGVRELNRISYLIKNDVCNTH
jgi:hypothetical protein